MNRPRVALLLDGVTVELSPAEVKALRGALYDRCSLEVAVSRMSEALPRQRSRASAAGARLRGIIRLLSGSLAPPEFPEYRRRVALEHADVTNEAMDNETRSSSQ